MTRTSFFKSVFVWFYLLYVRDYLTKVLLQEKINLEENEPVAEAQMLGYRGYLLRLGLIYEC